MVNINAMHALRPRPHRLDVPGVPQHVIQRGNDRQPCFFSEADYLRYRNDLREIALREGCAVHAYVLMTNHVHLLMTPAVAGAVARVMQSLGRRYVRHINDRYHRTGTLWEGRYKACLVDDGDYLMQCYRYIELNPLRAAMVVDPRDYTWSSHLANAYGHHDPLVTPHSAYLALSSDLIQRQLTYRGLVMETLDPAEVEAIRQHVQRQHAYGSHRFRAAIEKQLGRTAGPRKIGRPRKSESA
jgi:putative transposase